MIEDIVASAIGMGLASLGVSWFAKRRQSKPGWKSDAEKIAEEVIAAGNRLRARGEKVTVQSLQAEQLRFKKEGG